MAGLAIVSMVLMVAMVVYWFGIGPSGIASTNYMVSMVLMEHSINGCVVGRNSLVGLQQHGM